MEDQRDMPKPKAKARAKSVNPKSNKGWATNTDISMKENEENIDPWDDFLYMQGKKVGQTAAAPVVNN
eukprot:12415437-Karenia_brevis.AAC.1